MEAVNRSGEVTLVRGDVHYIYQISSENEFINKWLGQDFTYSTE